MKKPAKKQQAKPVKLTDKELFSKIEDSVKKRNYFFTKHAKTRSKERRVLPADVLRILKGETGFNRKRNKSKDKHEVGEAHWNYCIEGKDVDGKVRVILSFTDDNMPIITVIAI